jgi:hypothetical protein
MDHSSAVGTEALQADERSLPDEVEDIVGHPRRRVGVLDRNAFHGLDPAE